MHEKKKEMLFHVMIPLTVYLSQFHTLLAEKARQEERWQDQKPTMFSHTLTNASIERALNAKMIQRNLAYFYVNANSVI